MKKLDTSCWYVNPHSSRPVYNKDGIVELNTEQSRDDYEFFKALHLTEDNIGKDGRYSTCCPFIYECIVYGHNLRHGHIKTPTTSLTEAIMIVRIHFTKYWKGDCPEKYNENGG